MYGLQQAEILISSSFTLIGGTRSDTLVPQIIIIIMKSYIAPVSATKRRSWRSLMIQNKQFKRKEQKKFVESRWSLFNCKEVGFEDSFERRCCICSPDVVGKTIPHLPRSNQERTCSPFVQLRLEMDNIRLFKIRAHL